MKTKKHLIGGIVSALLTISVLSVAFVFSPLFVRAEERTVKDLLVDGTENTYAINSVEDLKVLRDAIADGSTQKKKTFILNTDLVITEDSDIGELQQERPQYVFNGTLNGQGHTITWEKNDQSLFAYLGTNAVVKNLHINGN